MDAVSARPHSLSRRALLLLVSSLAVPAAALAGRTRSLDVAVRLEELEKRHGGRLGVCMLDSMGEVLAGHRMNERFGLCSTFKLPLAGIILKEIDAGKLSAEHFVPYTKSDMVFFAPVTQENLERGGMTVLELAAAAQMRSDNVAANLLLDLIGGPKGFTEELRALGDRKTRLDRYEPELNVVPAGEMRDTTTPYAMAKTTAALTLGKVLSNESRKRLVGWMEATRTGSRRIRAGLPADWISGDKTGTGLAPGMPNKYNDVAATWPPERRSLIVAGYYEADGEYDKPRRVDEEVLAEVGRIVAVAMSR